jgi:hypothetical protein
MKLIITVLCIISFEFALAQKQNNAVTNATFNTVLGDKRIGHLSITDDSVNVKYELNDVIVQNLHYNIVDKTNVGSYTFVYVEYKQNTKSKLKWGPLNKPYIVYVFHFINENLLVLQSPGFANLEEAKKHYAGIKMEDKYFMTWYNRVRFVKYLKYPDINTASKQKIQQVINQWTAEFNESKIKLENLNPLLNVFDFAEDMWTKCLINNNLNPLLTFPNIYDKILSYHLPIPSIRRASDNKMILHLDTSYEKRITID